MNFWCSTCRDMASQSTTIMRNPLNKNKFSLTEKVLNQFRSSKTSNQILNLSERSPSRPVSRAFLGRLRSLSRSCPNLLKIFKSKIIPLSLLNKILTTNKWNPNDYLRKIFLTIWKIQNKFKVISALITLSMIFLNKKKMKSQLWVESKIQSAKIRKNK